MYFFPTVWLLNPVSEMTLDSFKTNSPVLTSLTDRKKHSIPLDQRNRQPHQRMTRHKGLNCACHWKPTYEIKRKMEFVRGICSNFAIFQDQNIRLQPKQCKSTAIFS